MRGEDTLKSSLGGRASFNRSIFNPSSYGSARGEQRLLQTGEHESTVPSFAPSPAELFDRGRRFAVVAAASPSSSSSSSSEEPSPPSARKSPTAGQPFRGIKRPRVAAHFSHHSSPVVPGSHSPPFRTSRVLFLTVVVVDSTAAWRARRSSSFTPRRRDSVNGKVSGFSSGILRRDNSWDARAPVGVSIFLRVCVYVCVHFFLFMGVFAKFTVWLVPHRISLSFRPTLRFATLCAQDYFTLARNKNPLRSARSLIDRRDSHVLASRFAGFHVHTVARYVLK